MAKGWVRLHRKLLDNPLMRKPAYRSVWIEILLRASYDEERTVIFGGKQITLKEGQFTTGAYKLAEATGVPRGTIERILKRFKSEEQIDIQTDKQCSMITVLKWQEYQGNEERVRNDRGTSEERVRTNQEVKKERSKEINTSSKEEAGNPTFGNEDINWVLTEFERIMTFPSQGKKQKDRFMAKHLLNNFSREQITTMLLYCKTQEYAPHIGSVEKLWYKRGDIIAGIQRANQPKKGTIQSL